MVQSARPLALPIAHLRGAWLIPAFAHLYPELPAGTWVTASSAAAVVFGGILAQARAWPDSSPRVLPEEHFAFRGGLERGKPWDGQGTRATDP
jgi:hypothetical protein